MTTGRHVWVVDPPEADGKAPGLLTEWRRGPSGWEGLVAYAVEAPGGRQLLVREWVPADRLAEV